MANCHVLTRRRTCRACGCASLVPLLSLGGQVIASGFHLTPDYPPVDRLIPLDLVRCDPSLAEDACGLVQLSHTVPGDLMYAAYGYRSGLNESMARHLGSIAQRAERLVKLGPGDLVVDIGANDGTLLLAYQAPGATLVGFEPSDIRPDAPTPHISFIHDYFSAVALRSRGFPPEAKIVTSIAMFYDLEEPGRFAAGVAFILSPDGVWILELSYLPLMLSQNSFDTICHEHLTYWALGPLERLLRSHGLSIVDVALNDVNGGSMQVTIVRHGGRLSEPQNDAKARIYNLKRRELELLLDESGPYDAFRERIESNRLALPELLRQLKKQGKKVVGYGASTKGNVTLQYCGITPELLPAIADRNARKWGVTTPGTRIPIISEEEMRAQNPDYLLALAWHFIPSFKAREAALLSKGCRFIVPLPTVKIIDD
jgi:hypothetical protein